MIVGVGIDVVEIARFEQALAARRALPPACSPTANASCRRTRWRRASRPRKPWPRRSARRAACSGPTPRSSPTAGGRPSLQVDGTVAAAAGRLGVTQWHLSLSHDAGIASAVVIAEGDRRGRPGRLGLSGRQAPRPLSLAAAHAGRLGSMRDAYQVAKVRAAEAKLHGARPGRRAHAAGGGRARLRLRDPAAPEPGRVYGARVVLLVGTGDNGGDALYAGERLARRGAAVTAIQAGPRLHPGGAAALRAAGGRFVAVGAAPRARRHPAPTARAPATTPGGTRGTPSGTRT